MNCWRCWRGRVLFQIRSLSWFCFLFQRFFFCYYCYYHFFHSNSKSSCVATILLKQNIGEITVKKVNVREIRSQAPQVPKCHIQVHRYFHSFALCWYINGTKFSENFLVVLVDDFDIVFLVWSISSLAFSFSGLLQFHISDLLLPLSRLKTRARD